MTRAFQWSVIFLKLLFNVLASTWNSAPPSKLHVFVCKRLASYAPSLIELKKRQDVSATKFLPKEAKSIRS